MGMKKTRIAGSEGLAPNPGSRGRGSRRQLADAVRAELGALGERLKSDELRVLVSIARRLVEGIRVYGPFDLARDRRAFRSKEAREELEDALVYLACAWLTQQERRPPMHGAGCRRQGHDFERAVRRELAGVFGEDLVRRGLQYRDGAECADVTAPGLWIECKAQRQTNPRGALAQAVRGAEGRGLKPVAVCKDEHRPPVVMMRFEDFLALLREWHAARVG
jgi:hypothetical protein